MSALQLHLAVVHLPVLLCPLATVLLVVATFRRQGTDHDLLQRLGWLLLVTATAASVAAYYSGPYALEQLAGDTTPIQELAEDHAVVGRAAFVGMVLVGVLAVQGLLQGLQGEPPAAWLRWLILVLALLLSYVLAWTAHLGGQLGHPELRGPSSLFPDL